jgi:hypothetical protein
VLQLGLAPVPISVNRRSRTGTNAKNRRGRSREFRQRMFDARQPCELASSSSRRSETSQAARRIEVNPSIIVLRDASIIVITLKRPQPSRFPQRRPAEFNAPIPNLQSRRDASSRCVRRPPPVQELS